MIASHHVDKFGEVIHTGPKVIGPDALNFEPIFEFLLSHIFGHPYFWT